MSNVKGTKSFQRNASFLKSTKRLTDEVEAAIILVILLNLLIPILTW